MVSPVMAPLERLKSLEGQAMAVANPPTVQGYRIGDAAAQSGVSATNIRYYEKEGLIAPQARGDNSYRLYTDADVHRLRFIRLCRAMDMSLDEVRTLLGLDLTLKADCATARDALDGHLEHVRARLAELRALEKDLKALRDRCDGTDALCHTIEALHERADALPVQAKPTAAVKRHV
jgi:DNA-binding transcriptional MerR regulator